MVKRCLKPSIAASAIAVASLCVFAVMRSNSTEQRAIRKQLAASASVLNVGGNDTYGKASDILRSLRGLVHEPFSVHMPDLPHSKSYSLQDTAVYLMHFRAQFSRLNLTFYNIDIEIVEEKRAQCTLTALLAGTTRAQNRVLEAREVRAEFVKIDGRWVITEVNAVEILRR